MARVSLCMIARDEESFLDGCLDSVAGLADEIVLVDTGSTDRTRELARARGAKVLGRPWDDDFAAPRNLAAAHATGDFILQLDADERLAPGAAEAIRRALRRPRFDVGMLRFHNAVRADAPVADVLAGTARAGAPAQLARVLRRTPDLRWEGIVHESVLDWAMRRGGRFEQLPADVVHLGYVPAIHASREKRARNLALLRRRVELEGDSVIPLGYLAAELLASGDVAGAHEALERGWAMLDAQPSYRSLRRLAVMRANVALRRGDAATARASVDRAEAHDGRNPDFDYLRGCALELEASQAGPRDPAFRSRLDAAAAAYVAALALLDDPRFEQVMLAEPGQVLARLGTVRLVAGSPAAAQEAFEAARALGAGTRVCLGEAEARLLRGDAAGALRVLEPALDAHPEGWILAARAAQALGANGDARLFLAQARARLGAGLAAPQAGAHVARLEASVGVPRTATG